MKGNPLVIDTLNARLREELTAINQYFVHAEMCENWGYESLADSIKKRSIVEMKHAESLIERILFFEGTPIVSSLNEIHIGSNVENIHHNDLGNENIAVKGYNESVKIAVDAGDNGTKMLLEEILEVEEEHVDDLEAQLDQIEQMGIQNYLAQQV